MTPYCSVNSGELAARALPDPPAIVLGVLEAAQLGGGGELGVVPVGDPGTGEGRLQPPGVGPRVLGSPHTAALAHVEQEADVGAPQALQEGLAVEAVDADRHHPRPGVGGARWHHATAVPSSSTSWPGIANRVTPRTVVAGATRAAPNRDASTP